MPYITSILAGMLAEALVSAQQATNTTQPTNAPTEQNCISGGFVSGTVVTSVVLADIGVRILDHTITWLYTNITPQQAATFVWEVITFQRFRQVEIEKPIEEKLLDDDLPQAVRTTLIKIIHHLQEISNNDKQVKCEIDENQFVCEYPRKTIKIKKISNNVNQVVERLSYLEDSPRTKSPDMSDNGSDNENLTSPQKTPSTPNNRSPLSTPPPNSEPLKLTSKEITKLFTDLVITNTEITLYLERHVSAWLSNGLITYIYNKKDFGIIYRIFLCLFSNRSGEVCFTPVMELDIIEYDVSFDPALLSQITNMRRAVENQELEGKGEVATIELVSSRSNQSLLSPKSIKKNSPLSSEHKKSPTKSKKRSHQPLQELKVVRTTTITAPTTGLIESDSDYKVEKPKIVPKHHLLSILHEDPEDPKLPERAPSFQNPPRVFDEISQGSNFRSNITTSPLTHTQIARSNTIQSTLHRHRSPSSSDLQSL